ncbi:glycoside hydrolase family 38 C-terminal domain-containing protein [Paenibacillus sp. XY044]|uniref:glycoside hydrolase family 38 C-terminal domain-containing protein n=1 Tax=Paenibacillus sp. XY044 TaxID=2026089 RepID=UPI0015C60E24|nr:glycoside hydrolase family 38 C-terminal domain-containing protein [Paenibacillus sp. XY044]
MKEQTVKSYFVDGYHGGIKGHMPLGSWTDVIRRLSLSPEWKLCLDIEPISWEALRRTDPRSYEWIRKHLLENGTPRMEMVAASYAQPFGWVIGGESNIRHLIRGKEIVQEHFPGLTVDTYATQEPCWSSSYPQMLRSLGYKRAVLKNPGTAWAGYASGINHETVLWVGPDGTSIPCVPRYACEELQNCWETEASQMEPAFAGKCLAHGISHPVGSFLQDLGWPANPRLDGEDVQYVTWREYMDEIAEAPSAKWHFTQEDIRCTLPWGEGTLQRMSREVRAAEQAIVSAEKLASVASVARGLDYPAEKFQAAWDQLLLSQHHDAWICATTREGRQQWAWQAGAQSWMAELLSDEIRESALDGFRQDDAAVGQPNTYAIRVFNTSGTPRKELTELEIPLEGGEKTVHLRETDGTPIPHQIVPTRVRPDDGSVQACRLIFEAEAPAMGYRTYLIEEALPAGPVDDQANRVQDGAFAVILDGEVQISTDLYEIRIDTARGGVITQLFDKALNESFVTVSRPFNEFTGYLIREERWFSSTESPVDVTVSENGPLRVVLEMKGRFANVEFLTTLIAAKGRRAIDCHVRFRYEEDIWIGDPWEMAPENRSTERRKSHHNARYKLQAQFPVALGNRKVYKNSAFDVTESRHDDTHFERWDEIVHSVILNWVDVYDEQHDLGLSIFSDHTTGYSHSQEDPLALTLGWGGEGGFWWGKRPLRGVQETRYAIMPHAGRWDRAGIQQECTNWTEPLLAVYGRTNAGLTGSWSLLDVSDPSIVVSSVTRDGRDLLVRLYNSGSEPASFSIKMSAEFGDVTAVELDGKFKERLQSIALPDHASQVNLSLQQHGLATLRYSDIRCNPDQIIGCDPSFG